MNRHYREAPSKRFPSAELPSKTDEGTQLSNVRRDVESKMDKHSASDAKPGKNYPPRYREDEEREYARTHGPVAPKMGHGPE